MHLSGAEAIEHVLQLIANTPDSIQFAIEAAYTREKESYYPALVRVRPFLGDLESFRYTYDNAVILRKIVTRRELGEWLVKNHNSETFELDDFKTKISRSLSLDRYESLTSSFEDSFGIKRPFVKFQGDLRSYHNRREPLLSKDLPAFPHISFAVRKLFGFDLVSHENFHGHIFIIFPVFRAMISSFELKDSTLNLEIDVASGEELLLKGWCAAQIGDSNFECTVTSKNVSLDLKGKPNQLAVWLLSASGELLDFVPMQWNIQSQPSEIESLLAGGEGQTVEFKESLASKDIAKELVAFSNSEGGNVLLGISDEGEVMGIKEDTKRQVEEFFQNVAQHNCTPPITLDITFPIIRTKPIANIRIRKSNTVHTLKDGRTYVRRGSTSRPATPSEIIKLVKERS